MDDIFHYFGGIVYGYLADAVWIVGTDARMCLLDNLHVWGADLSKNYEVWRTDTIPSGDLMRHCPVQLVCLPGFNGDLSQIAKKTLRAVILNSFTKDLGPLANCPLNYVEMNMFDGDLEPLERCPLTCVEMKRFKGDGSSECLDPIGRLTLKTFVMPAFDGDWSALATYCPLKYVVTRIFKGFFRANIANYGEIVPLGLTANGISEP